VRLSLACKWQLVEWGLGAWFGSQIPQAEHAQVLLLLCCWMASKVVGGQQHVQASEDVAAEAGLEEQDLCRLEFKVLEVMDGNLLCGYRAYLHRLGVPGA
jgi:hypothetical protein